MEEEEAVEHALWRYLLICKLYTFGLFSPLFSQLKIPIIIILYAMIIVLIKVVKHVACSFNITDWFSF